MILEDDIKEKSLAIIFYTLTGEFSKDEGAPIF